MMDWNSKLEITTIGLEGNSDVRIFQLAGRINMGNKEDIEALAEEAISDGVHYIILDMSEVPSITSAGLRAIHTIYKRISASSDLSGDTQGTKSPNFKLVVASPEVNKVIQISGFDKYIDVYDHLDAAIASF